MQPLLIRRRNRRREMRQRQSKRVRFSRCRRNRLALRYRLVQQIRRRLHLRLLAFLQNLRRLIEHHRNLVQPRQIILILLRRIERDQIHKRCQR